MYILTHLLGNIKMDFWEFILNKLLNNLTFICHESLLNAQLSV